MDNEKFRKVVEELAELQKKQLVLVDELFLAATNGNKIDWFPDRSFNAPAPAAPAPASPAPVAHPAVTAGAVKGIVKQVVMKEGAFGPGANFTLLVGGKTCFGMFWFNAKNAHRACAQFGLSAPSELVTANLVGRELLFTTKDKPYTGKDGQQRVGLDVDQVL